MRNKLMRLVSTFVIVAIAIIILQTGCKSSKNSSSAEVITAKVNSEFSIQLASNPSTGYSWFIEKCDTMAVQLISRNYTSDANPNQMAGVGGTETLNFKAIKKGKQLMQLVYKRAYSSENTEIKNFKVKIK